MTGLQCKADKMKCLGGPPWDSISPVTEDNSIAGTGHLSLPASPPPSPPPQSGLNGQCKNCGRQTDVNSFLSRNVHIFHYKSNLSIYM
jgi:hypothetical protein